MLLKSLYGTVIYDLSTFENSYDLIEEKIKNSLPHQNVSFKDTVNMFEISTVGLGEHFQVSEIQGNINKVRAGFYLIDNMDHFIDLILNFNFNRITEFKKDEDMSIKFLIDNLSNEKKDVLLYELIKQKTK